MEFEILKPAEIEKRSMEIISQELGETHFPEGQGEIIKRVIHTTADFSYAESMYFSPDAIARAKEALLAGAVIVTDTNMALAGMNKPAMHKLGLEAMCFMADQDVAREAKARGVTRATVSMERAALLPGKVIYVIGNAPTALISLHQMMEQGKAEPALVIGVPVGFVNVVESKELFVGGKVPCILARGRKGGSNVAAAIVNALLYQLTEREGFQ